MSLTSDYTDMYITQIGMIYRNCMSTSYHIFITMSRKKVDKKQKILGERCISYMPIKTRSYNKGKWGQRPIFRRKNRALSPFSPECYQRKNDKLRTILCQELS